jgi:autotransporter-associated beta strand protein
MNSKAQSLIAIATVCVATNLSTGAVWDGGGSPNNQWRVGDNWDTNSFPNNSSTDAEFSGNIAPASIGFSTNGSFETTARDLILRSSQTNSLTLNSDGTNRLVLARNVTLETGAGNLTIGRLRGGGAQTFSFADSTQVVTLSNFEPQSITLAGSGTLVVAGWINAGQAPRPISIGANATLDSRGNLLLSSGGSNNNNSNLLSGSGTLTSNAGGARTVEFGRKDTAGTSSATFSGTIKDGTVANSVLNFTLGATSTEHPDGTGARLDFRGTQTLSGNNTYSGSTTVNQGTLNLTGTHSGGGNYLVRGTSAVGSTAKTGTLTGTASIGLKADATFTVGGAQVANSRGILYPGAGASDTATLTIGTLGNNNDLIFATQSTLKLDVGDAGASDRVAMLGDVILTDLADHVLGLTQIPATTLSDTYTLVSFTGSLSGTFSSVYYNNVLDSDPTVEIGDTGYKLSYGSNAIQLVVVPEPSTLSLLGLAALPMLRRRRSA